MVLQDEHDIRDILQRLTLFVLEEFGTPGVP